jgi:acyl carrier protein
VELGLKPRIAAVQSTPPLLNTGEGMLPAHKKNETLRLVMLSGDWIPLGLPGRIEKYFPKARTISLGGATEASIWSIYHPITEVKKEYRSIPYGRPLANQKFYVLNHDMQFCPLKVQGDLYIGGDGLASGYLNDIDKTRNSFFLHPRLGPLYRTGDQGMLHEDGYIEFLGRKDFQVKIRGYRIELGEIENHLLSHEAVDGVIVLVRGEDPATRYLCAYIITDASAGAPHRELGASELREFLAKRLPEYMIPSYFITIDRKDLPLTPNGKIDRDALPGPEGKGPERETESLYVAPETSIEKIVVDICREVTGLEKIGIYDNLFEVGINSIDIAKINTMLKEALQIQFPLVKMFEYSTIHSLAEYFQQLTGDQPAETPPVDGITAQVQSETMDRGKNRIQQRRKKRTGSEQ